MNAAEFAIKNRLISFLVLMGSLIGGLLAYQNLPRFEDPEFTIRQAQIITQYPGATAEEVATEVTEALESALQQMQEVEEISSISSAGLSRITVEFKFKFSPTKSDLQGIFTKLRNRVSDAQSALPPNAMKTIVNDDFGDVFGLYLQLTGEGYTPKELHDYAKALRIELLSVDGVGKVVLNGIQSEAIYVEVSRERANALGVSVSQIFDDLSQQNSVVSAGTVDVGNQTLVITPSGRVDSVTAIEDLVVSTATSGTLVYLRDVATVSRKYQDPPQMVMRYNGQPSLGIGIANVLGGNVSKMGKAIDAKLAAGLERRPLGMEVHQYYHQGKVVDVAVFEFAKNVVAALVIVLVTLLIFMGLKSALIIGALLLFTIAATLAVMSIVGLPMHRISLGALIIALGMLVDNAIVVVDGILVGVRQGRKKLEVAKDVVQRTQWPLLAGTVVGILAFAPIGLTAGNMREFAGHLFWVVLISLLFSWLFAITAVPLLADMLFKESDPADHQVKPEGIMTRGYKGFMRGVLAVRWLIVTMVIGLFAMSIYGFQFVKSGFFPASTTPQIVVDYWLPEGTSIGQTEADLLVIEKKLQSFDEITDVHTLVGGGALRFTLVYGPEAPNSSYGHFLLKVSDHNLIPDLLPQIQNYLDQEFPDSQAKVWRFQLGPGGGSKIEAAFSGPDPVVLRQLANQAKAILAEDGEAISIKDDWRSQVPSIRPIYSESKGRRLGISREDLASALAVNYSGKSVGAYREGDTLIPIIARAPATERQGVDGISSVTVFSGVTGKAVPLSETVDGFETQWVNARLRRVDRVWTIKAQADPVPAVLASVVYERIKPKIEALELPSGYSLKWDGEQGDSSEATGDLFAAIPMGVLAMVLVVVLLFNALRQPLIIWLVVPLALIGVVFGLLVTNTAMEFMAMLGLLSLSGLLIKNGIVLVDQMDIEIREGKPRFDAVVDSATSRVRPVMMGALTTVLGVLPLLTDAFFKSMAVVLVFGLSFATVLTLIVVPALYSIFFGVKSSETSARRVNANDSDVAHRTSEYRRDEQDRGDYLEPDLYHDEYRYPEHERGEYRGSEYDRVEYRRADDERDEYRAPSRARVSDRYRDEYRGDHPEKYRDDQ